MKARIASKSKFLLFLILIIMNAQVVAQSGAGGILLLLPVSPTMTGMGELDVCLPSGDVYSGFHNPANGLYSQSFSHGIFTTFSQLQTPWLINLDFDISLNLGVFGLGWQSKNRAFTLMGRRYSFLVDLGNRVLTDEYGNLITEGKSKYKAESTSLAALYNLRNINLPLIISAGITRKHFGQRRSNWPDPGYQSSENNFYDFGFMISVPIEKRIINGLRFNFSPALGYSLENIGKGVRFETDSRPDPPPRWARAGGAISFSIINADGWEVFAFRGGRAAGTLMIEFPEPGEPEYRQINGLGKIDPVEHILYSRAGHDIEIYRGQEITLFDAFSYRYGRRIDQNGHINLYETGYGIRSDGVLLFLSYLTGMELFSRLSDFYQVEYDYSTYSEYYNHPLDNIQFKALTFRLKNINRIITGNLSGSEPIFFKRGRRKSSFHAGALTTFRTRSEKSDFDYDKKSPGVGYYLAFETYMSPCILGISIFQQGVKYIYHYNLMDGESNSAGYEDKSRKEFLYEYYHTLSFYGLFPFVLTDRFRFFPGIQVEEYLHRHLSDKYDFDDRNPQKIPVHFSALLGCDLVLNTNTGLRFFIYQGLNRLKDYNLFGKYYRDSGFGFTLMTNF